MCLGAAMSFFIGEIIYGHEMPGDGAVALVQSWKRREEDFPAYRVPHIRAGVLREEALALFAEYAERHPTVGGLNDFARGIAALALRL
jgi:tRNA(Arg) A34 adenosine deaminase TadA